MKSSEEETVYMPVESRRPAAVAGDETEFSASGDAVQPVPRVELCPPDDAQTQFTRIVEHPSTGEHGAVEQVRVEDEETILSGAIARSVCSRQLSVEPLPAGTRLDMGTYTVKEVLGQGGFGITYLAYDHSLKVDCVIKENFPRQLAGRSCEDSISVHSYQLGQETDSYPVVLENFVREARMIAAAGRYKQHPNIVGVSRLFVENNTAYYVMRYVQGRTLDTDLAAGSWDEARLLPVLAGLLGGLEYLHDNGILHLDIKPSNIMMQEGNTPMLIDFGASRQLNADSGAGVIFSKGYAPPEQRDYSRAAQIGPWSDIYALGATVYHMISGKKACDAPAPLLPGDFPRYGEAFLAAVNKALALEPAARWQSAREWLAELRRLDEMKAEAEQEARMKEAEEAYLRQLEDYKKQLEEQKRQVEDMQRRLQKLEDQEEPPQVLELEVCDLEEKTLLPVPVCPPDFNPQAYPRSVELLAEIERLRGELMPRMRRLTEQINHLIDIGIPFVKKQVQVQLRRLQSSLNQTADACRAFINDPDVQWQVRQKVTQLKEGASEAACRLEEAGREAATLARTVITSLKNRWKW